MKTRRWVWKDPVYCIRIEVVVGDALDTFMRVCSKRYGWGLTDEEYRNIETCAGSAPFGIDPEYGPTVSLWFNRKRVSTRTEFGVSTIGHEATHGAIHVFDYVKAPIGVETHEPFAHYQKYLFTETYRRMRRAGL